MPYIKIKDCSECGKCFIERDYTEDSWEHCEKWKCKLEGKYIVRYHESRDKNPKVPKWCPIRWGAKNAGSK